jgi:hypothetical protein
MKHISPLGELLGGHGDYFTRARQDHGDCSQHALTSTNCNS